MDFYLFFLLANIITTFSTKINTLNVKSHNPPFCYDCKHYKPTSYSNYNNLGKCALFIRVYEKRMLYEYADIARQDEHKCGKNGKDFEPK
jgi:hypothetical protein